MPARARALPTWPHRHLIPFRPHSRVPRPPPTPQLYTRDGEVTLLARSTHYLWRDEAQPLIAEGVLAKCSDE
jgi:hypothetical protein